MLLLLATYESGYCRTKSGFWIKGTWDSVLAMPFIAVALWQISISEPWLSYLSNKNNDVCNPWRKKWYYIIMLPTQCLTEIFLPLNGKFAFLLICINNNILLICSIYKYWTLSRFMYSWTILYNLVTISSNKVIANDGKITGC